MFSYVIQEDLHIFDYYEKKVVTPIDPLKVGLHPQCLFILVLKCIHIDLLALNVRS